MDKKILIVIISLLVLMAGGLFGFLEYKSYYDVTIKFHHDNLTIDIYRQDKGSAIQTISNDQTIRLKRGNYYYIPQGDTFSNDSVYFSIDSNQTVKIDPSYSDQHLASILSADKAILHQVMTEKYPIISSSYTIIDEKLYQHGEWYSARLVQQPEDPSVMPDIYRVILKNQAGQWVIVVSPRLIISRLDFPNIPKEIISSVNAAPSNDAYAL
jgi:hypothetical protein